MINIFKFDMSTEALNIVWQIVAHDLNTHTAQAIAKRITVLWLCIAV